MTIVLANGKDIPIERLNVNYSFETSEYQMNIEVCEDVTLKEIKDAVTAESCKTITVKRDRKPDKVYEDFKLSGISENIADSSFGNSGVMLTLKLPDMDDAATESSSEE